MIHYLSFNLKKNLDRINLPIKKLLIKMLKKKKHLISCLNLSKLKHPNKKIIPIMMNIIIYVIKKLI
jgi:hypothetical protein